MMSFCKLNRCMQIRIGSGRVFRLAERKPTGIKGQDSSTAIFHVIRRNNGCSKKVLKNDDTFGGCAR